MPTNTVTIRSTDGWVPVYTGPTTNLIAIQKVSGTAEAQVAIATETPDISMGNILPLKELWNVGLDGGEILYVKCVGSTSDNIFTITD